MTLRSVTDGVQAERADMCINSLLQKHDASWLYHACFSTWTLYHTLHTMIRHCLAGLELELYLPHEYQYIFWLVRPVLSAVSLMLAHYDCF